MKLYNIGETVGIYAMFVNEDQEPIEAVNTRVSVIHDNNVLVADVPMNYDILNKKYSYFWTIPTNAPEGDYVAIVKGEVESVLREGIANEFQVGGDIANKINSIYNFSENGNLIILTNPF